MRKDMQKWEEKLTESNEGDKYSQNNDIHNTILDDNPATLSSLLVGIDRCTDLF